MSQAKVDARKEYKKNRKQIIAKEKRKNKIAKGVAYLLLLCLLVGVGYSFYAKVHPKPEASNETMYYLTAQDSYGFLTPSLPESK